MFSNLIESEAHTAELKRRGSFLFATVSAYALLFAAAGVGSIYAYEAHLDNQSLEMTALVTMLPATAPPPKTVPERGPQPRPQRTSTIADNTARAPMRTMSQTDVTDMSRVPKEIGVAGNNVPPMIHGAKIGPRNVDVGSPFSKDTGPGNIYGGPDSGGTELAKDLPPEMPQPKTESKPPKQNVVKSLGVIESKVTHKAVPPYPELAKRARVSGPVTVQILLDEQGRVISARASSGHPLLRDAAERAAFQTRFSPTLLSNQPVKVSGFITFNFVLQ